MQFKHYYVSESFIDTLKVNRNVKLDFSDDSVDIVISGDTLTFREINNDSCNIEQYRAASGTSGLHCIIHSFNLIDVENNRLILTAKYQYFNEKGNASKVKKLEKLSFDRTKIDGLCAGPTRTQQRIFTIVFFGFAIVIGGLRLLLEDE